MALTEDTLNLIKAALGEKLPGGKAEAEKLVMGIRDGITTGSLSKGSAAGASQLSPPLSRPLQRLSPPIQSCRTLWRAYPRL
jgi:hypothetical protein